jgi:hypothetical protein
MRHTESTRDFCILVENIAKLPLEIRASIMSYSANSLLWRFARVLAWRPELFNCLRDKTIETLLPNALDCWIRGDLGDGYKESMKQNKRQGLKFFRMGIDGLGIRSIQLLESRSALPDSTLSSCPWYIVEDIARLDDFKILSNVGSYHRS